MRALVAQGLIFSLLMNVLGGVAAAQSPVEDNKVHGCYRPSSYTVETWNAMSAEAQGRMCKDNSLNAVPRMENPYNPYESSTKPAVSRGLGIAGVVTALGGVALLGPWGTPVTVVDTTYCVTDRYDVYEGGCNARGTQAAIGAALLGGGILMAWAGFRTKKVHLSPSVGRQSMGVAGKVTW